MTLEAIVARFGLWALFLGAGLEGETAVVTGGVLAHQGLLPWQGAVVAATSGSLLADQLLFAAGRRYRDRAFVRRMTARPAFARALSAFERRPVSFILAFRFLYGLRVVSPVAIGTSRVPFRLFLPLNALAAAVWATLFTFIGYRFGDGLAALLGRFKPGGGTVALIGAAAVAAALVAAWVLRRRARTRATA